MQEVTRHSSTTSCVAVSKSKRFPSTVPDENVSTSKTTVTSFSTSDDPMATLKEYKVFVSHAGEDKTTIAIPLRNELRKRGITSFVDDCDIPCGADATLCMENAMKTAQIAVIVLSPEFVAKEWTFKELFYFLKRRKDCIRQGRNPPIIIPVFYRLSTTEIHDEPRLDRIDQNGNRLYESSRFLERQRDGNPEANIRLMKKALRTLLRMMGVENVYGATNDSSREMFKKRQACLNEICEKVCKTEEQIRSGVMTQDKTRKELQHSCHPCYEGQMITIRGTMETLTIEKTYESKEVYNSRGTFIERSTRTKVTVQQGDKIEIRAMCKLQCAGKDEKHTCHP